MESGILEDDSHEGGVVVDEIDVKKVEGNSTMVEETDSSKGEVVGSSENVNWTNGDTLKNSKLAKNGSSSSAVQKPRAKLSKSSSVSAKTRTHDGQSVKPKVGSKGGVKIVESSSKSSGTGTRRATLDSVPSVSKLRVKF